MNRRIWLVLSVVAISVLRSSQAFGETSLTASTLAEGRHSPVRAIKHSDVVFMYDNPDMYEPYGCTVLGWAGSQSPDRIRLAHQRGVRLFAVSIGFRTEFARMIDFTPQFMEATCRNFAGEPFIVPWLWDHKHKEQPAWWFCTNSPLYREYLYSRLRQVIASGADALHIDDYTGTAGAVTWLDACFCPSCMSGFREYLKRKLSQERLEELKLGDLSKFDYHQYLIEQGITPEKYHTQRAQLPLATEVLDFQVKSATQFVAEFREKANEWKGSHMPLAVNSSLVGPINLAITPYVDYFCCEVDHQAGKRQVPLHPIYVYKLADGLDRPVTSTASGGDWADVAANNLPGLVRTWIALSYAFGHNFMAPHRQWCYTREKGTHWYSGPVEEYAPLYRFARSNAEILDDFESIAKVAVVYDSHSQRQGKGQIEPICTALAELNVPFTIVVQGDDWLPGYNLREFDLAQYAAIVIPQNLAPSADLEQVLSSPSVQKNFVRWKSPQDAVALADRWIRLSPEKQLFVTVRRHLREKRLAVHLVNRQYDPARDAVTPVQNVVITLDRAILPGPPANSQLGTVRSFSEQSGSVEVRANAEHVELNVPAVDLWTIVELRWP